MTVECHGYGKPLPSVVWRKDGKEVQKIATFSEAYANQVVQVLKQTNAAPWNFTSRLYLRTGGITYNESGNYTCEVFNGVGTNYSEQQSIEILCEYTFSLPEQETNTLPRTFPFHSFPNI